MKNLLYGSVRRKIALVPLLLPTSLLVPAQSTTGRSAAKQQPLIIDIYAGELGSYGQQRIKASHPDRIAREGVRFTQHMPTYRNESL